MEIFLNGEKLENSKIFRNYKIELQRILKLKIEVFNVKTEEIFSFVVRSNDIIGKLKTQIKTVLNLNESEKLILFFDGEIMEDDKKMNDYDLESAKKIFLFDNNKKPLNSFFFFKFKKIKNNI